MMKNDPIATGKNANTPEKYEPIELLATVTRITQNVTKPARQATMRSGNRYRINDGIQYRCTLGAPVHKPEKEHGAEPHQERTTQAGSQRMFLRKRGVCEGEQGAGSIGNQTADCTGSDKLRRVLERENDHGGAAGGRQRGNQRSDERTAALDHDGCRHDDRGGHRDLQRQPVPEHWIPDESAHFTASRCRTT
jgi:hypothetical protein